MCSTFTCIYSYTYSIKIEVTTTIAPSLLVNRCTMVYNTMLYNNGRKCSLFLFLIMKFLKQDCRCKVFLDQFFLCVQLFMYRYVQASLFFCFWFCLFDLCHQTARAEILQSTATLYALCIVSMPRHQIVIASHRSSEVLLKR